MIRLQDVEELKARLLSGLSSDQPSHTSDSSYEWVLRDLFMTNKYSSEYKKELVNSELDEKGNTALLTICGSKYIKDFDPELESSVVINQLLEAGSNPNVANKNGHTPLIILTALNKKGLVKTLIQNGADVNFQEPSFGFNALMVALHFNNQDLATLLIENNADPSATRIDGSTALSDSRTKNQPSITNLILSITGGETDEEYKNRDGELRASDLESPKLAKKDISAAPSKSPSPKITPITEKQRLLDLFKESIGL